MPLFVSFADDAGALDVEPQAQTPATLYAATE